MKMFLRSGIYSLLLAGLLIAGDLAAAERPPNFIFILVDDQGYYDLGCYGATEFATPRIDQLAAQGIRFTDYYAAAPICSPSRAGLVTGCYPRRVGFHIWVQRPNSKYGIHRDELTMAELFKSNGYTTACIGKWHLGFHQPFLPRQQGFDHYYGLLHNLPEQAYLEDKGGVPLLRNDEIVKRPVDPSELARLYTDETIDFMTQNKDRPFFVYLPHTMLHAPLGVSEEFRGSSGWSIYGDAIQELDHQVGRIMDALENLGLADNTIVVYASDNGRGPGRNSQQPIHGRKLTTYEGGLRVPCIVWGPGAGVAQNKESAAVIHAMDWYPTLASLAGIKVPRERIIDGRDLSLLITGKTDTIPVFDQKSSLNAGVPLRRPWDPAKEWSDKVTRREYLNAFFYHGSQGTLAAVRSGPWKLYLNPLLALYNLDEDPGETMTIQNIQVSGKLRGMAILFQEEMMLHARPPGQADISDQLGAGKETEKFIH